ncbi:MAG: carbohydrate ABC transporter permease [Clostridia bacterium]|nr:carbohydrate ABC transporter permease [Clostridia bacterium]
MAEQDINKVSTKQKVTKIFVQIGLYLFLGIIAFIVLFPFYWMIISSFKTIKEYEAFIPTLYPHDFSVQGYNAVWEADNLVRAFGNTVLVGLVSTILSLIITVLSAFAFARLEFKGKNVMFALLLATMMIPGELFTITNYQTVMKEFEWGNTYKVLIIPFLVSVFYIYLLKQNFMQIPNELYLAAKVDGTTDLKYLWKVMIPLALPTLISITILKMMGAWNTYMWPNLVLTGDDGKKLWLITLAIRKNDFTATNAEDGLANIPAQMAAVTLVSIPLFMVFIFLRKYIMKGVSRSGIKG